MHYLLVPPINIQMRKTTASDRGPDDAAHRAAQSTAVTLFAAMPARSTEPFSIRPSIGRVVHRALQRRQGLKRGGWGRTRAVAGRYRSTGPNHAQHDTFEWRARFRRRKHVPFQVSSEAA